MYSVGVYSYLLFLLLCFGGDLYVLRPFFRSPLIHSGLLRHDLFFFGTCRRVYYDCILGLVLMTMSVPRGCLFKTVAPI